MINQCRFINGNKCTTVEGDADNGEYSYHVFGNSLQQPHHTNTYPHNHPHTHPHTHTHTQTDSPVLTLWPTTLHCIHVLSVVPLSTNILSSPQRVFVASLCITSAWTPAERQRVCSKLTVLVSIIAVG